MSDPRFARLKSDPRFRRPRKVQSKVVVDDRFKDIFGTGKGKKKRTATARNVDKYGRPLSDTYEQNNLRRFYRLENEEEDSTLQSATAVPDYARGEGLIESSDESEDDQNDGSELDDVVELGHDHSKPVTVFEDEAEIDLDESHFADLDAQAAAYSKALADKKDEQTEVTRSRRLAVVNLDWDHVKATHLYKIFASLVSPTAPVLTSAVKPVNSEPKPSVRGGSTPVARGSVLSVRIYPSEFGKQRLAREEKEGPPPEIFKKRNQDDENDVTEKNIYEVGDQNEYDDVALRNYQLERLRYFYAIVTCDTVDAASHIYSELDGTELERSANVLDLSFVPDDMTFEDECRDEATGNRGTIYKALDFVTPALRHSKVALTWDDDDPERNQVTRRALAREEIEEGDFKAYIASSSSSESEADENGHPNPRRRKKQAASRDKLRALLLGGGDDQMPEGWGGINADKGAVDMEITFTPGLTEASVDWDESTLEKYQRKMKDKRKKRRETAKENGAEDRHEGIGMNDDFFDGEDENEVPVDKEDRSRNNMKKDSRKHDVSKNSSRPLATPSELALLVSADDPEAEPEHFNMKAILKAEKASKRQGKKMKKKGEHDEIQEDFAIDVGDERFKALHEDYNFAIDPSNPHFKKTKSMVALMQARSKMHEDSSAASPKTSAMEDQQSLQSLVENVKRKSKAVQQGLGKRRRL